MAEGVTSTVFLDFGGLFSLKPGYLSMKFGYYSKRLDSYVLILGSMQELVCGYFLRSYEGFPNEGVCGLVGRLTAPMFKSKGGGLE